MELDSNLADSWRKGCMLFFSVSFIIEVFMGFLLLPDTKSMILPNNNLTSNKSGKLDRFSFLLILWQASKKSNLIIVTWFVFDSLGWVLFLCEIELFVETGRMSVVD